MVPSASIPAVRQNRSKLTETASQALPTAPIPFGGEAIDVVLTFFMALLSFVDSTPRAYRLKASNAAPPISTFAGAIPAWISSALLFLMAQCQDRGDGRRAGCRNHGDRDRGCRRQARQTGREEKARCDEGADHRRVRRPDGRVIDQRAGARRRGDRPARYPQHPG